jgi:hypothetical protein
MSTDVVESLAKSAVVVAGRAYLTVRGRGITELRSGSQSRFRRWWWTLLVCGPLFASLGLYSVATLLVARGNPREFATDCE